MTDDDLMAVLDQTVAAVLAALAEVEDWRPMTGKPSQYAVDVVADGPATELLTGAGFGVLSEESGIHHGDREVVVVIDPVDGSTNASRGVPWFATSLCAVDADGARAALVVNLASGERFEAVRGRGARRDGEPIRVSGQTDAARSLVCLCGVPSTVGPWGQGRIMGAAALDLCSVGAGRFDGYLDNTAGIHGPWDYLGGMLVVQEAGGVVADLQGRDLVVLDHDARRGPVAAASPALLDQLRAFHEVGRLNAVRRRAHLALLRIFKRLPRRGRLAIVHALAPSYSVGSICIVERVDGRILLVRHSYRNAWGFPGGLLNRGEGPVAAAIREAREECDIAIEVIGEPAVVVDPDPRRVDVVYRCRTDEPDAARAVGPEVTAVGWYPRDGLPDLQHEAAGALVALARTQRSSP